MDRADRSDFLRSFYRRYEGAPVEQLREDSAEMLSQLILTKSFPAAIRRVREHRALGHRTVLITGALDFVVEPLKPLFDDIISASLAVDDEGATSARWSTCRPPARAGPRRSTTTPPATTSTWPSRGLRRLVERPADARGGGLPGGGEPRDPPGEHRPQAGLAHRAVVEGPGLLAQPTLPLAPKRFETKAAPR
jgi:hypothetical protein